MKYFLSHSSALVEQALRGMVAASGGRLCLLDGFPDVQVVLRSQWDSAQVSLVSGGGSGHEPSHAGFVGAGMLTAAVAGEVFASPSAQAVLAALLAVGGRAGVLLIVKNYTGDRLNFGWAAQQARLRGIPVEVVVVGDDLALPQAPQPRGLAGTLFVHKIAGHLAAQGAPLAEVARVAREVASATVSLGLSLNQCHPPGPLWQGPADRETVPSRLGHDEVELGLGIHGEPGVGLLPLQPAEQLVEHMLLRLPQDLGPCALLLNNLGGVPALEMALLTQMILQSPLADSIQLLIGPAALMTAYDMKGISLSLLPLRPSWEEALLAPVPSTAWPQPTRPGPPQVRPLPDGLEPLSWSPSSHPDRARLLTCLAQTCIESEAQLNGLDAQVGDGDTGTTLARGGLRLLQELSEMPLAEPESLLLALAQLCSKALGGSSGILLSLLLQRAALALSANQGSIVEALLKAARELPEDGGAKLGQRTAIDALEPALCSLILGNYQEAARAARQGAQATASMGFAQAGRSAAVPERNLLGVVDPGAEAVARVFERLAEEAERAQTRPEI
jgi:dihydroxyacetone kinase